MIDLIYKILLTLLNKENQGYVSPTEFNLVASQVQSQIYREYFEDENRDKNKENRGLVNNGYSNLSANQRHRIEQFADIATINISSDIFELPTNLYLLEQDGVESVKTDRVIQEVERSQINYLKRSSVKPSDVYPVYEKYGKSIVVSPDTIDEIRVRYLRSPKNPNWTYVVLPTGDEMYNPADPAFQDFELHESELSNITVRMLSYFGLTIREAEVVQVAENLKANLNQKDNG